MLAMRASGICRFTVAEPSRLFELQHKVKEVMTLDRAALIKRLRTLLGDLSMRVAGRNKDDVTESLSIVRF